MAQVTQRATKRLMAATGRYKAADGSMKNNWTEVGIMLEGVADNGTPTMTLLLNPSFDIAGALMQQRMAQHEINTQGPVGREQVRDVNSMSLVNVGVFDLQQQQPQQMVAPQPVRNAAQIQQPQQMVAPAAPQPAPVAPQPAPTAFDDYEDAVAF